MPSLASTLMQAEESLRRGMDLWAPDWQDIRNLMAPMCADSLTFTSPGQSRTREMYDTTALMANQELGANIMGGATNQAFDWHGLKIRDEELQKDQEVKLWLSDVNKHLLSAYNASNFYQSLHTLYLNYGAFGTAALFTGDSVTSAPGYPPSLSFTPVPHWSYCFAEDADGNANTFFRRARYTPLQAIAKFGQDNVSKKTRELAKNSQMAYTPQTYLHAIWPREDWKIGTVNNRQFPWGNAYLEMESEHVCHESGFHEFPVSVVRWEKLGDSPWGFGPGHMALPDVRTLNRMKELQIQMLALWVQPPLKQVQEGVLGSISLEPLAINIVKDPNDLTAFELNGRPDLVQISQEDLRNSINKIFYVTNLQAVPPPDAGQMTAFEVAQRVSEMQRLMGPAFHRLLVELLNPLIDRVFGLEWRKGNIPMPPTKIIEAARRRKGQIDIEYLGPLARAQKSADVQAISQVYAVGAQMMQATGNAALFDKLDSDLAIERVAEAANCPPEIVRDAIGVARIRAARAEHQRQLEAGATQQQTAESLGSIAPFLKAIGDMGGGGQERMAA